MFQTKVLSEMCVDHDGRGGRVSASEAQGGTVIPTKVLFQCGGATVFPMKVLSEMCVDHDGRGTASEAQGRTVIPTKVLFQCS